jgi:adenylate cyclase
MLDVVGYSKLMADDEADALNRYLEVRSDLLEPTIASHSGRIVKHTGDGALVEFVSVTDAMQCALEIQAKLAELETSSNTKQKLQLRVGINLGEIIVDGDDIFGNGVNVAARVEALALPGGIAVTATVREHLRNIKGLSFEDAGEFNVKNIPHPVRIVHVEQKSAGFNAVVRSKKKRSTFVFFKIVAGVAFWAFAAVLYFGWPVLTQFSLEQPKGSNSLQESGKPSVIVMPFENLSGDPEQTYFSDGMTDNLITDLSRISGLLVMARNTSFSFRDRQEATDARSVGEALGVRYVVEGSIQRSGEHIRINASLTDAQTGFQLWAKRLDREFKDLFALQDDTAAGIIEALKVELTEEERRQLSKQYTISLEAYDFYLRAWEELWRFNSAGRLQAQKYLREALLLDPHFALAKSILATSYTNRNGDAMQNNDAMLDLALELAQQAQRIDPNLPAVQASLGLVHMFRREFDAAEKAFSQAIEMDPNYADAYAMRAWNRHYSGEPEKALEGFEYALVLNPRAPFPYLNALAEVYFSLGDYEQSIRFNIEATSRNPEALRNRIFLAAAYAEMDRIEDAEWEVEEALLLQPDLSLSNLEDIAPYRDPATAERLLKALSAAGLPE